MNYLLAPLHAHFDFGFGATGNAFKDAADELDKSSDAKKDNLFNANLPINFLYRHAIELYLKSAIVIFHRRLKLPYGAAPFDADPMVLVDGDWRPFNRVHSIAILWTYVEKLFQDHADWLAESTKADWSLSADVASQVSIIETHDPRSTFFRYPTTKDLNSDKSKSAMKELAQDELFDMVKKSDGKKVFAMIVEDKNKEFVSGYVYDDEPGMALNAVLREMAQMCANLHAAMRWEICGGW